MLLQPLPVSRVANAAPGAAVLVAGVATFSGGPPVVAAAGIVGSVLAGAVLAVRGFRAGVDCRAGPVVVRGFTRAVESVVPL